MDMIKRLNKLRELRIDNHKYKYVVCSSDMPDSLEELYITMNHISTMVINLAHLPNLRLMHIEAFQSHIALASDTPPQAFAKLILHVKSLKLTRTDAANILAAPNFTHFDLSAEEYYASLIDEIFNGLDAPELRYFSSRGSGASQQHTYDLRAPRLQIVQQGVYGCLPKSAPNNDHQSRPNSPFNRIETLIHRYTMSAVCNPDQISSAAPREINHYWRAPHRSPGLHVAPDVKRD
jgi:hypothetical protein